MADHTIRSAAFGGYMCFWFHLGTNLHVYYLTEVIAFINKAVPCCQ